MLPYPWVIVVVKPFNTNKVAVPGKAVLSEVDYFLLYGGRESDKEHIGDKEVTRNMTFPDGELNKRKEGGWGEKHSS